LTCEQHLLHMPGKRWNEAQPRAHTHTWSSVNLDYIYSLLSVLSGFSHPPHYTLRACVFFRTVNLYC